jgi:F-type H+-transporting ATPase subunit b
MHATTPAMAAIAPPSSSGGTRAGNRLGTEVDASVLQRPTRSARAVNRGAQPLTRRAQLCAATMLLFAAVPANASDQLELTPDPLVTGILLVSFVLLIAPLNALIFRPLFRVMDEREQRIAGARERAGHIEVQAEEALTRYEDSILAAREEAVLERRQHIETARTELMQTTRVAKAEAEQELSRAREELDGSIASARESLRGTASGLAQTAAESVLGRSLS